MKEYIHSEIIKEKRARHIFLGVVCIAVVLFFFFSNMYKLTKEAGPLDMYCDNMQVTFLVTLIFATLYTVVLFSSEYQNKTINQLIVIPINSVRFISAKVIIILCFNWSIMLIPTLISTLVMAICQYQVKMNYVLGLITINIMDGLLLTIVMLPIIFLTILCRGNMLLSLLLNALYIISCFLINMLPVSQEFSQKMIAYAHPLGSYALIHNWIVFRSVAYEISMIAKPHESPFLAMSGMLVYVVLGFAGAKSILDRNKGISD